MTISLLNFVVGNCLGFFEKQCFKIKGLKVGENPAVGSSILLVSNDAEIFISNERDEITWQIRSLYDSNNRNWFSFDLVAQLLGYQINTAIMDKKNSELLSRNTGQIIMRFKKDCALESIDRLNELEKRRSKKM